ncbi:MAG: phosphoenolpyruvate carboxylase, partial [Verrucomicrobiota bacterium]
MSSSQPTASLLVQSGLESLEAEFQEVLDCFREVLLSSSRPALAEALDGDATTLDLGDAAQVSSIAFQLLDMVEERVANETRQRRMVELGPAAEKGLWAHCLESLKREGVSEEKIAGAFHTVRIEPVFTAHPTEAKRPSVRERHRDIFELLCQFRDANLPEKERSRLREDFVTALEALWHTGEIHVEKPTIERELRNVLYYLREVFPSTVETLTARLQTAWEEAGFSPETLRDAGDGPKIRFGLWIGGDRDGHPFVTAEVTRNTLKQLREQAIKLYRAELA